MSVVLFILNLIEAIIEYFLLIIIVLLHLGVPYNFMFFLIDVCFIFLVLFDAFLPKKLENHPLFEPRRYAIITLRILSILAIIIILLNLDASKEAISNLLEVYKGKE